MFPIIKFPTLNEYILTSAMVLLHKPHSAYLSNSSDSYDRRRLLARDTMDAVSWEFLRESEKLLNGDGPSFYTTSPLILHWGYETLVYLTSVTRTEPQERTHAAIKTVHSALQKINSRWRAAGMRNPPRSLACYICRYLLCYRRISRYFGSSLSAYMVCSESKDMNR